jgi:hypothetical protein
MRKYIRTLIHSWIFYQLEQFLKYKADAKNICVVQKRPTIYPGDVFATEPQQGTEVVDIIFTQ